MVTTNQPAAEGLVSESGRVSARRSGASTASAKKKTAAAKPTATPSLKSRQAARTGSQSSRTESKPDKLVCRYCGSDDLAPSFKKRRDARCRACFKQRYGSPARNKNDTHRNRVKAKK
jgi:hypothetical protein